MDEVYPHQGLANELGTAHVIIFLILKKNRKGCIVELKRGMIEIRTILS